MCLSGFRVRLGNNQRARALDMKEDLDKIREELIRHLEQDTLGLSRFKDNVPIIQPHNSSLSFELTSSDNNYDYMDHKGYVSSSMEGYSVLQTEIEKMSGLDSLSESGMDFIHMLYCYRSVSRAMPEIVINITDKLPQKKIREMELKQAEINRKVIDVLRPEIMKLNDLFCFTIKAVDQIRASIADLLSFSNVTVLPESTPILSVIASDSQYASIVRLIDVIAILDYLKYAKSASLSNDFDRYKRALKSQVHGNEAIEEQVMLQQFLEHQNSRKRNHFIFQYLCDEIHRPYPNSTMGPRDVLRDLLFYTERQLAAGGYATPNQKFRLLRVMVHLVLLIDYREDDRILEDDGDTTNSGSGGTNTAKEKAKFDPSRFKAEDDIFNPRQSKTYGVVQSRFQEYPVVPLFGDMTLTLVFALDRSPRFDSSAVGPAWGSQPDRRIIANYDLSANWDAIRDNYSDFSVHLSTLINQLKGNPVNLSSVNPRAVDTAEASFKLVRLGLRHALRMSCLLHQVLAWKYSHPCPLSKLDQLGVPRDTEGVEYERVIRYNLAPEQLSEMVDLISMLKSLSNLLLEAEPLLAPLVRFHVHHSLQQMVQGDLLPIIHRADKRKLPFLPALLHVRALVADWVDGQEPLEDYKQYKRKDGSVNVTNHPARVVGLSYTQLHLLQCHLSALFTDDVVSKTSRSIMGRRADIDDGDLKKFQDFLLDSFSFQSALTMGVITRACCDMGNLWFREFYLEKTHCIQFPIEMSLPWILTEHVVTQRTHKAPMLEDILFALDIYNDAANLALHTLRQQHLYNEVEAEANLVLDQVIYFLSADLYEYHKNVAASSLLEHSFKGKLEELKDESYLTVPQRRYSIPVGQRHVQLLGRSVDLNFLISRHLNDKMRRDMEVAIQRFESTDCAAVVELGGFVSILRAAHETISKEVEVDTFDEILDECNESFSPSLRKHDRITSQFLFSLLEDVLPNYSYNNTTQRFVRSPVELRPVEYGKVPKKRAVEQLYGATCAKAYEMYGRLTRNFIGRVHMEEFLTVSGSLNVPRLVDEICSFITERFQKLSLYVRALLKHLPVVPSTDSSRKGQTTESYHHIEVVFRELLEFDDIKPEVFQSFREIGNALLFLRDLSEVLEVHDQVEFINLSPLLGLVPDSVQADRRLHVKHAPVVKAFKKLAMGVDARIASSLPVAAKSIFDIAFANAAQGDGDAGEKDIFKVVVTRIRSAFDELGLYQKWAPFPSQTSAALAGSADNLSFYRLWSALHFLYCVEDEAHNSAEVSNEEEFGHGFTAAGALVLHLLRQKDSFMCTDHTMRLLLVQATTRADYALRLAGAECEGKLEAAMHAEALNVDDDGYLPEEVSYFLDNASNAKALYDEFFAFFEGEFGPVQEPRGATGGKGGDRLVVFHPPRS